MIEIVVAGVPAPQGSKTRTKWGVHEDNPNTKPWRAAVAADATEAMSGRQPLTGPLLVEAIFVFSRPKSHFGTGRNEDVLKPSAPVFVTTIPDLDKLCRAVGDALTGIAIRRDSEIVRWDAVKVYGHPARAEIRIRPA